MFGSELVRETSSFADMLEDEFGFFVTHIELDGDFDVNFRLSGDSVIKVSQRRPLSESLTNLASILSSTNFSHLEPGNFQYIDLRFGDKVFVNEEVVDPELEVEVPLVPENTEAAPTLEIPDVVVPSVDDEAVVAEGEEEEEEELLEDVPVEGGDATDTPEVGADDDTSTED